MSARNLQRNSHFLEMTASLLLALKLVVLILAVIWFGDTPFELALICVLFAVVPRYFEL